MTRLVEAVYVAVALWVIAVRVVTSSMLKDFYVAASVMESGVYVAAAIVSCVLDSDAWVAAASVLERSVYVAVVVVSCVSEIDVWVVVAAGAFSGPCSSQ
jgi:ADP-glucose pyrophosphorylase